jgi:UPF0755 protein
MIMRRRLRQCTRALLVSAFVAVAGCGGEGEGEPLRVNVPVGASFGQITDSLAAKGIIGNKFFFKAYARVKGVASAVKPGTYAFKRGTAWGTVLDDMREGKVLTARIVIPEGWDLRGIAPRIAEATGLKEDSVLAVLADPKNAERFGTPGPTLEGYLYPATYTYPLGVPLDTILHNMVATYRSHWTPARRARADSMGMSEREIIALASIVEKEARHREEMGTISAVYHNRLKRGYRLEADPTVQYALGEHQARLMYSHIDSVAENPYNTYRITGLPPGPIASPSELGMDAALYPAEADFMFFVARSDGSHIFTRTLDEHNRAKQNIRREREAETR